MIAHAGEAIRVWNEGQLQRVDEGEARLWRGLVDFKRQAPLSKSALPGAQLNRHIYVICCAVLVGTSARRRVRPQPGRVRYPACRAQRRVCPDLCRSEGCRDHSCFIGVLEQRIDHSSHGDGTILRRPTTRCPPDHFAEHLLLICWQRGERRLEIRSRVPGR